MATAHITAATVRRLLIAQPALAAEIDHRSSTLGWVEAVGLLAVRLDCDPGVAAAGLERYYWPTLRGQGSTKITKCTSRVREETSTITGSRCSCCSDYPVTKRMQEWRARQDRVGARAKARAFDHVARGMVLI